MSMKRKMKREHNNKLLKQMSKLPGERLTPAQKRITQQIEDFFTEKGHIQGVAEAQQIFKQRLVNDIPKIKGVGPALYKEIAKALGFPEIKEMEKKK
ncbi:hypothetical protein [Priestia aryabhattai]|uniref:hypothetical protein n=1 Tax=Priestia aryabhattai TaxID=412384 RepID=UPI0023B1AC9A|nr:hypothetical protein [Priestia aryabhattai]MDE8676475.1 hypothetical protein [Priestia aryabhattai]